MNKEAVPNDIRNPKYVLLVQQWTTGGFAKMNNKAMNKALQKNYPGNYELIHPDDTSSSKYSDKSKYRYYVSFSFTSAYRWEGPGAVKKGIYGTTASGLLYFYDRLNGTYLGNTGEELQSALKTLTFFGQFVEKYR